MGARPAAAHDSPHELTAPIRQRREMHMTEPRPSPTPHRTIAIRAAVLAALGIAIALPLALTSHGADNAQAAQSQPMQGPQVSVAQVVEQQVTDFQEFTGRIEAVERVELRPRVSGYI